MWGEVFGGSFPELLLQPHEDPPTLLVTVYNAGHDSGLSTSK
jgi:hypothetical protein